MVVVTCLIILKWIHHTLSRIGDEECCPGEKIQARLETVLAHSSGVETSECTNRHSCDSSEPSEICLTFPNVEPSHCQPDVSALQSEVSSLEAVLEIRTEEVRRLREVLNRMEVWREDRGTQTGEEGEWGDSDTEEERRR